MTQDWHITRSRIAIFGICPTSVRSIEQICLTAEKVRPASKDMNVAFKMFNTVLKEDCIFLLRKIFK